MRDELVDGLLATAFDGSVAAERAVAEFSARWTARLVGGVRVLVDPPVSAAPVVLDTVQWHEDAVLKFVHQTFVLQRADLASHQRGQATVLTAPVRALADRLADDDAPRLHDLAELARAQGRTPRRARRRAVVDYVALLTDGRAGACSTC